MPCTCVDANILLGIVDNFHGTFAGQEPRLCVGNCVKRKGDRPQANEKKEMPFHVNNGLWLSLTSY